MKKRIALVISAVCVVMCAVMLSGCINPFKKIIQGVQNVNAYTYGNADEYKTGGGAVVDNISSIHVDWISGNVEVVYGDVEVPTFSEMWGDGSYSEDAELRYRVSYGSLYIKFAKSGYIIGANSPSKHLTVTLPRDIGDMMFLYVDTVSAEVNVKVDLLSAEIETVSGNIDMEGAIKNLDVDTVSGKTVAALDNASDIDVDSVSGRIYLAINSFSYYPYKIDLDTVSGDVTIDLKSDSAFKLSYDSVSGDFSTDFECNTAGKNVYTFGSDGIAIDVDTTSGNLGVYKIK